MAARKKKKAVAAKKKKPAKAAKAKKAPAKKSTKKSKKAAKKAKKPASRKAKKSVAARKTPARKTPAKKAAKKSIGEGDYAASRRFLKDEAGFVEKNKANIPAMGKAAEKALDGPEGAALRDAEAAAAARSRDIF